MIISHRHQFIFIHFGRTSGTSISNMLANFLGPDDILCNDQRYFWKKNSFHKHDTPRGIREKIGIDIWNRYYKFTFERNPFEKILTKYWGYAGRVPKKFYKKIPTYIWGEPISFKTWFAFQKMMSLFSGGKTKFPKHYPQYIDDDGSVMVDFIGRFENRTQHLNLLGERLGLPLDPDFHYGNSHRKERKPYVECYEPWMREHIEQVFADDLKFLGYQFGKPAPLDAIYDNWDQNSQAKRVAA